MKHKIMTEQYVKISRLAKNNTIILANKLYKKNM